MTYVQGHMLSVQTLFLLLNQAKGKKLTHLSALQSTEVKLGAAEKRSDILNNLYKEFHVK